MKNCLHDVFELFVVTRRRTELEANSHVEPGGPNVMKHFGRLLAAAVIVVMCGIVDVAVRAEDDNDQGEDKGANRYIVTVLTSDLPGPPNTDVVLQNAWGVAFTPGASPFWIADNATGCSTLYDGSGVPQPQPTPLRVKIPLPGGVIPSTACQHKDPN